jgi:hypothetical protein
VTLDGIADADAFRNVLDTAKQRAQIRKHNAEEADGVSKATDPGKLKRQKDWTAWSRSLNNYLSTILGHDGVPLNYIIRENDQPDYSLEQTADYDFEQLAVNCAPITGQVFKTDARRVHQLIHGFVQNETAETWIKPREKRHNGRLDYQALLAHYGGEGNKQVRIKEAENLRKTLIYKNERVMSFEKFLTNMQSMFTGFDDSGETLTNGQKMRLLFEKVQATNLQGAKSALQISFDQDVAGAAVTYDFIANSLSAAAASAPENSTRQTSGVGSQGGAEAPKSGVKLPDGSVHAGHYENWAALLEGEKQQVFAERKRQGITSKRKPQAGKSKAAAVKTKKKALDKLTRKVAALETKAKNLKKKVAFESDDDEAEETEPQDNAGDQFGGRKSKKKKKGP